MIAEDEMRILMELRNNGRKKITEIAEKTGLPKSTAYDKKRKLEKTVIRKYVTITDNSGIKAWLIVAKDKESELKENKSINNLYLTNKGFLAEVVCKDLEELENVKELLKAKEHLIVSEIKKEDFWTRTEHLELLKTENPSTSLKAN